MKGVTSYHLCPIMLARSKSQALPTFKETILYMGITHKALP